MTAAVNANIQGNSLCAASRLYNVPIESLRRSLVISQVDVECRPGPQTVLSKEDRLV